MKSNTPIFKNEVRIKGVAPDGSTRLVIVLNTLTYAAADTIIAALLQSGPSRVTHLYGQHGGSTNTAPITLPTDMRTTNRTNFVATINGYDNGGFWIPLLAAPSVVATDPTVYNGNSATYFFRIPGNIPSTQFTGNFVPGTSQIFGLGLAVAANTNDRTQDIIISALGNGAFTPFAIASNGQEAIDYPLQVTIPAS